MLVNTVIELSLIKLKSLKLVLVVVAMAIEESDFSRTMETILKVKWHKD